MNKKQAFLTGTLILAFLVFAFIGLCKNIFYSEVKVYSDKGAKNGVLEPINSFAKRAFVSENEIAFYRFTDVQKVLLNNIFLENRNASVVLRLSIRFPKKNDTSGFIPESLGLGFLNDEDFRKNGKLDFNISGHPLVLCDLNSAYYSTQGNGPGFNTVDISFALPVDKKAGALELKEGIFVQSSFPVKIRSVTLSSSVIGFDKSEKIPYYGFSSNGGKLDFSSTGFDLTGCSNIFSINSTNNNLSPEIELKLNQQSENKNFVFSFGGEKIRVKRLEKTIIPSLALKNIFANMEIMENKENVLAVLMKNNTTRNFSEKNSSGWTINPVSTDPGLILKWPMKNWRCEDYELFQWDRYPNILFFDTKNYAVQSRFFGRIAFFIEKKGYKGKLLTNEELFGKHDYNAHDYSAESLALFFNKAYTTNFRLNEEEELLLEILVRNGMLARIDDPLKPYVSKGGAVLSVSREIPSYNREPLLAHEGWHTLFFTDEEFRNYVSVVYNVMDSQSLAFLLDYFRSQPSLGYDVNDDYLMKNEFMAYILQNTEGHLGEYFVKRAAWQSVKKFTPELCEFVIKTNGSGFEDCGKMLSEFVSDKYNLVPGNIGLVTYY